MNEGTRVRYEARARVMKAMAHPTRLFIINELSRAEQCVADLTKMIGVDVSTVSKHLGVLRVAGLVQDDKRGAKVFYKLRVPCVQNFFSCIETVLEANAEDQMRVVR